jgi:hypothetical protein
MCLCPIGVSAGEAIDQKAIEYLVSISTVELEGVDAPNAGLAPTRWSAPIKVAIARNCDTPWEATSVTVRTLVTRLDRVAAPTKVHLEHTEYDQHKHNFAIALVCSAYSGDVFGAATNPGVDQPRVGELSFQLRDDSRHHFCSAGITYGKGGSLRTASLMMDEELVVAPQDKVTFSSKEISGSEMLDLCLYSAFGLRMENPEFFARRTEFLSGLYRAGLRPGMNEMQVMKAYRDYYAKGTNLN